MNPPPPPAPALIKPPVIEQSSFKQKLHTIISLPEYKPPSSTNYKLPVKSIYYQLRFGA